MNANSVYCVAVCKMWGCRVFEAAQPDKAFIGMAHLSSAEAGPVSLELQSGASSGAASVSVGDSTSDPGSSSQIDLPSPLLHQALEGRKAALSFLLLNEKVQKVPTTQQNCRIAHALTLATESAAAAHMFGEVMKAPSSVG